MNKLYEEVDGAVRLPDRVDVRLITCSADAREPILERLRNIPGWSIGDLDSEALIDDVENDVSRALAEVPITAAKDLVCDLNAIGVDACIELTASTLGERPAAEARS